MVQQGRPSRPPGWYADANGQQRWWDGLRWTGYVNGPVPTKSVVTNQQSAAIAAHVLGPFTWVVGPAIIYLAAQKDQTYVRDQAMEALNWQVLWTIPVLIAIVLTVVLVGFLLIFVFALLELFGMVHAVTRVQRGEWYRYPINIRLFRPGT